MGLFNGGLLGSILKNSARSREDEIRRAAAREWYNSYTKPTSNSSANYSRHECKFCGMTFSRGPRPSVNAGGPCKNSPYGKHSWIEI